MIHGMPMGARGSGRLIPLRSRTLLPSLKASFSAKGAAAGGASSTSIARAKKERNWTDLETAVQDDALLSTVPWSRMDPSS